MKDYVKIIIIIIIGGVITGMMLWNSFQNSDRKVKKILGDLSSNDDNIRFQAIDRLEISCHSGCG